jgi:S-DNA-T family DNA segregation ATPase FtsK/SpoIIIE
VDKNTAWSKIAEPTKSGWQISVTTTVNTLDAISPAFVPFAERWTTEAVRRDGLRTTENLKALIAAQREHNSAATTTRKAACQRRIARKESKNPLSTGRRAARTSVKASRSHKDAAKKDLAAAKKNYPSTLKTRAIQLHALHAVPAGGATYLWSTADDWALWPAGTSLSLILLNIAALWLGRRKLSVYVDDDATADERALLERLQPEYWTQHAEARGLGGTVTARPALTASGITVPVRLDAKWTPEALASAEGNVRALLGCRTSLRVEIRPGDRGGWADITMRTRLAADGADMMWTASRPGIGLDTVTGEPVEIPLENRLTIAGASGSGKSWSSRPHMAYAHLMGDVVFVDGKGDEATVWEKVMRVAVEPDEIRQAVAEVHAEMHRRKHDMKRRGISVWDQKQLTLFVDEGRVILALKDKLLVQMLIDISALGRSRGVVLWWATQYPVTSGDAPGIHAQIAANTDSRFALRVKNLTHASVALDDDADYGPHLIPATKAMRGHGYLAGHGPNLIRTWTMNDEMVKALPSKAWRGTVAPAEVPAPAPVPAPAAPAAPAAAEYQGLRLVKDGDFHLAPPTLPAVPAQPVAPVAEGTDAKILEALRLLRPPVRQKDICEASGLPKGTVSKAVGRLVKGGHLVRNEDGTVSIAAAGEVSA